MKRLMTCVAMLFAVCAVFGLVARERTILRAAEERARRAEATARDALERARNASQSAAASNTFAPPQTEPDLAFSEPAPETSPVFDLQFGKVDPVNGLEALRQKYVEQQAVKALLMQADELQSALDTTHSEIRELDAQTRLREVSETLARISEEFSETQAAPLAERMLEIYRKPYPDAAVEPGLPETPEVMEEEIPQQLPALDADGV